MRTTNRPGFRALEQAVGAYARVDGAASHLGNAARLFADGLLGAALDADEQMRLTIGLYDIASRPYNPARGLWDWEETWFTRRLPPPPARILIGAAGAGREAFALAERGYHVAAFEPAPKMCERAELAAAGRFPVVCADYAAFADAALHGGDGSGSNGSGGSARDRNHGLAAIVSEPWDAVLFGWTSFTHLLDPVVRNAALAAAHQLAPRGPILLSYVARLGDPGAPSSRIWRMARRIGRAAGRARGLNGDASDDGIQFDRAIGFVRPFSPEEIDVMAAAIGRTALHEPAAGFPHATLVP